MACIYENVEDWCCKLVSLSCAGYIDGMLIIPQLLSSVMGSCLSLFFQFISIVVAVGFCLKSLSQQSRMKCIHIKMQQFCSL